MTSEKPGRWWKCGCRRKLWQEFRRALATYINHRELWGLRGSVASLQSELASGGRAEFLFRPDGAAIRRSVCGADHAEWLTSWAYDLRGRLASVTYQFGGTPNRTAGYEYDETGIARRFEPLDPACYLCLFEPTGAAYRIAGAVALATTFRSNGEVERACFLDASGGEVSRVDCVHDGTGRLVEEFQSGLPKGALRSTHRYDERGLRIETILVRDQHPVSSQTMRYNPQGDRVLHVLRQSTPGERKLSYQFEYDERGNWVSQTCEGACERRSLQYVD